ncbi:hypothetical protein ACFSNO_27235 [Streptomyces cirratus]
MANPGDGVRFAAGVHLLRQRRHQVVHDALHAVAQLPDAARGEAVGHQAAQAPVIVRIDVQQVPVERGRQAEPGVTRGGVALVDGQAGVGEAFPYVRLVDDQPYRGAVGQGDVVDAALLPQPPVHGVGVSCERLAERLGEGCPLRLRAAVRALRHAVSSV